MNTYRPQIICGRYVFNECGLDGVSEPGYLETRMWGITAVTGAGRKTGAVVQQLSHQNDVRTAYTRLHGSPMVYLLVRMMLQQRVADHREQTGVHAGKSTY